MYILRCFDIIHQLSTNLQILSGKDLYNQTIVVSSDDIFRVRFPNIFVDYPLGPMRVGDKLWTNWNKTHLKLWQTQLNFALWHTSSACGVSSEHLNYKNNDLEYVCVRRFSCIHTVF